MLRRQKILFFLLRFFFCFFVFFARSTNQSKGKTRWKRGRQKQSGGGVEKVKKKKLKNMKALMRIILSHRWVGGHRGSMGWGHEGVFQVARCRTWSSGRLGIELEWVSRVTAAVERENRLHFFSFLFLTTQQNMKRTESKKKVEAKKEIKPLDHPPGFFFFFSSFHLWSGRWNNRRFFFTFYGFILFVFYLFFFGGVAHFSSISNRSRSLIFSTIYFSIFIKNWIMNEKWIH